MAQCEATVTNEKSPNYGKRCQRVTVRGATTCAAHGGVEASTTPELVGGYHQAKRCTAKRTNGEPCKKFAINGGTVCASHGGMAPQVKRAARDRLLEMVDPALVQLKRIIENDRTSDADKLRAISMVLNRTGHHEKAELTVEAKPWEGLVANVLRDGGDDIVDAEVVDDEHDPDEERERLNAILRQAGVDPNAREDDFRPEQVAFPPAETADVVPMKRRASSEPPAHLRRVRR